MNTEIDDCYDSEYDDHVKGEVNLATPAKYVKGLGRGKQKPVDALTIRLPKFLTDLAIKKSNQLKTKNSTKQIDVKIKSDSSSINGDAKYQYNFKPPAQSKSSRYDTSFYDWHIAKLRNSEGCGSSSFSTPSSSADDVNITSLKETIKWPAVDSVKTTCDDMIESQSKNKENSLDFKSIGQMLCGSGNSDHVDGCHGDNETREATNNTNNLKDQFKLCIQNIPYTFSEDDLMGSLSTYGDISDCRVFRGPANHSMAIVTMDNQKACEWAISCLHGEESPFPGYPDGEVPNLAVFQIKEGEGT